jgi:hypothetical protein
MMLARGSSLSAIRSTEFSKLETAVQGHFALDSANVYFGHGVFANGSSDQHGEIMACAKTGCADHPTAFATGVDRPVQIATDGTKVYWTESGASNTGNDGRIWRAPK